MYNGVQYPGLANGRDKRIVVNYLAAVAQKMAGYLMSPAPTYQFGDAKAQQSWREIYAANQLASLDYEAALWASVLGDAAYRLGWDVAAQRVSITSVDVSQLWARTQPDDKRILEWVAQRYYVEHDTLPGNLPDQQPLTLGSRPLGSGDARSVEVIEEWTAAHYRLWLDGRLAQLYPRLALSFPPPRSLLVCWL